MIPKPIIAVVEAARRTSTAFVQLRLAKKSEASEKVLAERRKALNAALEAQEQVVIALEKKLEEVKLARARSAGASSAEHWNGFFRVAGKILDLVTKEVHGEKVTRKDVEDVIDAEIVGEVKERRR